MRQGTEEVRNETRDGRHGTEEGVIWGTEDRRKRERKPRGRNKTKKTFRYRSLGSKNRYKKNSVSSGTHLIQIIKFRNKTFSFASDLLVVEPYSFTFAPN